MFIQPISHNVYTVRASRNHSLQPQPKNTIPSFSGKNEFYGDRYSECAHGDIYGNAVIHNLGVKSLRSFFLGDTFPMITLNDSIYARRVYQPEGDAIYMIKMNDNSRIGKVDCLLSELVLRGNNSVDEVGYLEYLDVGAREGVVNINKVQRSHSSHIGGKCNINSLSTGYFDTGAVYNVKNDIRVKDLTTGKLRVWVSKDENLQIDKFTIDVARKEDLTKRGFDAEEFFTGNIKVGHLNFINGSGVLKVTDRAECLPTLSRDNVSNGKLVFYIGYMKIVDNVNVDELNVSNNSIVKNADVKDVARLSGSAKVENLVMSGENSKVFISDSAKVGKIIFKEGDGKVYLVPTAHSYPSILSSQVQDGEIEKL